MKRSGSVFWTLTLLLYSVLVPTAWAAPRSPASRAAVVIQTPAARERLQSGEPYTIGWHVDNPAGSIAHVAVTFSADDGRTYEPAGGCGRVPVVAAPGQGDFTCMWSNPGPATTRGRIRIEATDADGRPVTDAEVRTIVVIAAPDGLPWPWQQQDVGAVGAAGDASYGGGSFTVRGSGADIWGTADEFHYVYQAIENSPEAMEIVARVDSVEDIDAWTKAGLTFRRTLDPGAAQASIFVSPGKGIAFQRRTKSGGASVHTAGPALTAPVWLRLTSELTTTCAPDCSNVVVVRGYYRHSATDAWTLVGTEQFANDSPQFGFAGLAVSSHVDGTAASAAFSNVVRRDLPSWSVAHVGGGSGSASGLEDPLTLSASGADIWGAADAFEYVYQVGTSITARVRSLSNTNAWTKAGVMVRQSLSPDSPQVMVAVTPGKGIAMQYRDTPGGSTAQLAQVTGAAPVWVRLTHTDAATYVGSYSTDGATWNELGRASITAGTAPLAGLALTSHTTDGSSATAVFDEVRLEP